MEQYCIDCGEPLPNVRGTIANQDGRCPACDDASWESDETRIHPGPSPLGCRHCRPDDDLMITLDDLE
jgi:hypothetical protein